MDRESFAVEYFEVAMKIMEEVEADSEGQE